MSNTIQTLDYDRLIDDWETEKAYCFVFDGETHYLPKSQVEDIRETAKEVDIPLWLVEAKGLEDFVK